MWVFLSINVGPHLYCKLVHWMEKFDQGNDTHKSEPVMWSSHKGSQCLYYHASGKVFFTETGQGRDTPVEGTCSLYPFHASMGYPSF